MNRLKSRNPVKSGAFTRVELVVVVICVGVVLALLIPAVTRSRTGARRNQCSIYLTNVTRATLAYEMANKQYPGWTQSYGWFSGTQGDPSTPDDINPRDFVFHQKVAGWAVVLLPYLDAQATYEVWTQDRYPVIQGTQYTQNAAPNLAIMQCPSRPTSTAARGRNSYVSNNGMHHLLINGEIPRPLAVEDGDELEALRRSMKTANGVFNNQFAGGETPTGGLVRSTDLIDGLGYTVLFSENLQAIPWQQIRVAESDSAALLASAAPPAEDMMPRSPDNDIVYPLGEARFVQGFVWHWEDDDAEVQQAMGCPPVSAVHRINGRPVIGGEARDITSTEMAEMAIAEVAHVARPSSAHPSGVYLGMADGSTRFVTDSMDYRIYQALMTPHGEQSDVPMSEFVLPAEEL